MGGEAAGPAATPPESPPKPVDPALARAASIAAAAKKAASHAVQAARSKQRTSEEDRRRANTTTTRASPEEEADVGLESSLEITPADLGDRAVASPAAAVAERGSTRPPPDGARAAPAPAPAPAVSPTRARSASQTDVDKLTFSDLAALLRAPIAALPKRQAAATEASPRIAAATIAALDRSRSAIAERDARLVGTDDGSHADSPYMPPRGATATLSAPVPAPVPRADEEDNAESAYSEDTFAESSGSDRAGTAVGALQTVAVQDAAPQRVPAPAEVLLSVAPSPAAPAPSLTANLTTAASNPPQPPPASAIAASNIPPGSVGTQKPEVAPGAVHETSAPGPASTTSAALRLEQPPLPPLQSHVDNGDTSIASSVPPPPPAHPPPRPIAMDVSAISGAASQNAATADASQGFVWQGAPPGYAGGGPAVAWNFVQQSPYQVPVQFYASGALPYPPPLPFGGYSMFSGAPPGSVYAIPQPASLSSTALDATIMSRSEQPFAASTSSRTAGAALAIALRAAASVALSKNHSQATHPPPMASVPIPAAAAAPAPQLVDRVPDPAPTLAAHESRLRGSSPESENSGTRLGSAKRPNPRPHVDGAAAPTGKQSIKTRPHSRAASGEVRITAAPPSRQSTADRMVPSPAVPYPANHVDAGAANALIAQAVAERYDAESARAGLEAEVGRLRRLLAQQHPSQSLPQHRQGHERHRTGSPQGPMRPQLPPETHPSLSLISFVDEPSLPTAPHFPVPEQVALAPVNSAALAPEVRSPTVLSFTPPAPAGAAASPPVSSSMQPRARAARLRASMNSGVVPLMPSEERPIAADDTTAAVPPRDDVALPSTLREALAASAVFRHAATRGALGQRRWAAGATSATDAVPSRNHRGVVYPVGPDSAAYFTDLAAAEAQAASDGLEAFVPLRLVSALQREMEVQVRA